MRREETYMVMNYIHKHVNETLEQLKYRIRTYEIDSSAACCEDGDCKDCVDCTFKNIYRLIDDMKEDENA